MHEIKIGKSELGISLNEQKIPNELHHVTLVRALF